MLKVVTIFPTSKSMKINGFSSMIQLLQVSAQRILSLNVLEDLILTFQMIMNGIDQMRPVKVLIFFFMKEKVKPKSK